MRVLVVSDSHGRNDYVKRAVEQTKKTYGTIDVMLHLGDVEDDVEELYEMIPGDVYIVEGNNDFGLDLPEYLRIPLSGHTILMTHGHRQQVHMDLYRLELFAEEQEADIVMYGHTHYPYLEETDDLTILNPGSLTFPRQEGRARTYMVMQMDEDGTVEYLWQELEEEEDKGLFRIFFDRL